MATPSLEFTLIFIKHPKQLQKPLQETCPLFPCSRICVSGFDKALAKICLLCDFFRDSLIVKFFAIYSGIKCACADYTIIATRKIDVYFCLYPHGLKTGRTEASTNAFGTNWCGHGLYPFFICYLIAASPLSPIATRSPDTSTCCL